MRLKSSFINNNMIDANIQNMKLAVPIIGWIYYHYTVLIWLLAITKLEKLTRLKTIN